LKLIPKREWSVGEKHRAVVQLTRCYDEPLTVEFDIEVGQAVETVTKPPSPPRPPKGKFLRLPKPIPVYKEAKGLETCKTWSQMDPPWTGLDVVEIKSIGEDRDKQYDVFINMDSDDLHSFLRRKRLSSNEQDFVKRLYQTSILLYSLILYNDLSKINGGREDLLPILMKSVSKVCLDLAYGESLVRSVDD
jgi:hypothetical protein